MLQGIYDAAASLQSLERWQNTISENLASGPTAGYKQIEFAVEGAAAGKVDRTKGAMPKSSTSTSFAPGDVAQTGKSSDLAVQGKGFFQVKKPDGSSVYTRDGEFIFNSAGTLVTKQGWQVQGDGGPITLDPAKGAATVSQDGTVSQEDTTVGKVPLFDFTDPSALQRLDGGYFTAGQGVTPTPVAAPQILQGFTESGNSSPLRSMVGLVTVSRAYEASQKIITAQDDLMHQAIQTLGNSGS